MWERRELEGARGWSGGISASGGDAQQLGRDAGSQQAGQHNTDELQQRQPQGTGGDRKHVAADEGGHRAEAAVVVQAARVGRAALAAPAGPAAAEGHRAVLLQPPGRGQPVAVALHTAARQGALQRVQGVRHPVVLPVRQQRLAQPLLETLSQGLAVQQRREPGRQHGRQHGRQEGAVGAQESPVLRSGAEAAQEAPDDDGEAGGQEDGGGAGVAAGRQRQVAAQRHLGPEADDEHGQPRCPEDEAEGHEGQLEQQGHGALGPCCRREGGGGHGEGLPRPSVPQGSAGLGRLGAVRGAGGPRRFPEQPSVRAQCSVPAAVGVSPAAPPPRPLFEGAVRGGPAAPGRAAGLGRGGGEWPTASSAGPRGPGSTPRSPGQVNGCDWQLLLPAALRTLSREHPVRGKLDINF